MAHTDDGNAGWSNETTNLPDSFWEDIPKPLYWRVMIAPTRPKEVSRGGIVLAISNQEAQDVLNFIGQIVAVGPMAGKHDRLGGTGTEASPDFPKVGEYVAFGRYAGQRLIHKGVKMLLCNDDEILATVPNPETLQTIK